MDCLCAGWIAARVVGGAGFGCLPPVPLPSQPPGIAGHFRGWGPADMPAPGDLQRVVVFVARQHVEGARMPAVHGGRRWQGNPKAG